ncbi:Fpg/Nei family DNA glycosylase [Mycetocola reblochoni]|uniref:DNA-(apurinic or apyrimidinic site) lyase n=2 Tax=Mycetocola reblochoni TaxID=331618 RepID=A0A1R4JD85_9MICO|nr:DNA-formamidopyrimidine glycosylase family protein [Mycetocola reblochoni]RLP69943.1 Fpg/Nei family DNA glycosylase [Mycetocola reblochoni]SJN29988.1 Formamidopyrimidine-DNA glycosylase [Mycetocola reblochoni REB411]
MPEGHSVHRIARQFDANFVGKRIAVSSPQGRFAAGAAELDGRTLNRVFAVGKQMFAEFDGDRWLRVHLGLYGAWDFAGRILTDPTIASAQGRMGQTNQRGTQLPEPTDVGGEDSVSSIGAPRVSRLRMSEQTRALDAAGESFPPVPVGQVRARLLTDEQLADLRGPTACVVTDGAGVQAVIDRLGPDPLHDDGPRAQEAFVAAVRRRRTAIALLLMDQSVVSGIGNVYRAELLFRARLNPHTPGRALSEDTAAALWQDWSRLLRIGVETGQMMTMDGLSPEENRRAMATLADRHWVYKREGLPCRVCGTNIVLEELGARKLYWCPSCQR